MAIYHCLKHCQTQPNMFGFKDHGMSVAYVGACLLTLAVLTTVPCVHSERQCKVDQYWDHGTSKCSPCTDICTNARQQDTEEECERKCKDFMASKDCSAVEYYDQNIGKCQLCEGLCHQAKQRGTEQECFDKCGVFLQKSTPLAKTETEAAAASKDDIETETGMSRTEIALTCVVVAVVIVSAVGLVILCWERLMKFHLPCIRVKYPTQATNQREESHPMNESQAEEGNGRA